VYIHFYYKNCSLSTIPINCAKFLKIPFNKMAFLIHTFFIRTLRFELQCWFLFFDGFEHQNALNSSLTQACMFLIIYGFACSYCICRYMNNLENVGINMNCSQYINFTSIIFTICSVGYKKSINFLWSFNIRILVKLMFLFSVPYTLMFLFFVWFQV